MNHDEILDACPISIYVYQYADSNFRIIYTNQHFKFLYHTWEEFISGIDTVQLDHLHQLHQAGNTNIEWEGDHIIGGTHQVIRIISTLELHHYTGIIYQPTIASRDHRLLQESNTRFRGIFDNIETVAIQGYDMNGTVTYWNAAAESFYGYSSSEALGKNLIDLIIFPDQARQVREGFAYMSASGQPIPSGELELRHRDGHIVPVYSAHTLVQIPGIGTELFCIDTDLSKIRQIEQASKAKTDFLANMSHEIRTPLNAIIGITHLLRKSGGGERSRLDQIDQSSRHLLSIVNDILDLSRIEAGRLSLTNQNFNLSSLIDTVTSLIGSQAQAKGIEVITSISPESPLSLNGDVVRLRQALLNYASNAVKFTESGSIEIIVKPISEVLDTGEIQFEFSVRDTGPGINKEDQLRLFKPFEQLSQSASRGHTGTGLGLSITRRLANLMHGTSGVRSEVGRGSTFWFTATLKIADEEVYEVSETSSTEEIEGILSRECSGSRILLVEDNPVNQTVAIELLSSVGLSVHTAINGHEAISSISSNRYDLILMDIQMPGMDGLTATREIARLYPESTVPIIAMTANVFDEGRTEAREAGMVDFIPKPVNPLELYTTIYHWLPKSTQPTQPTTVRGDQSSPSNNTDQSRQWFELIDAMPEIDTHSGLISSNQNHRIYLEILKLFVESHSGDAEILQQLVNKGEWQEAHRITHAIKGTSGNIGAMQLHSMITELDMGLRTENSEMVQQYLPGVLNQLSHIIDQLRKITSIEPEPSSLSQSSSIHCQYIIDQLSDLLQERNSRSIVVAGENAHQLRRVLGESRYQQLIRHINNFDFSQAMEVLDETDHPNTNSR